MTDEEMAEEYADRTRVVDENTKAGTDCISLVQDYEGNIIDIHERIQQAFLAGLKAGRPKCYKITDWKDNSQFPNDELKAYLVRLYQDHYVICELDITEGYRQFYLPDNLEEIDPQDVIAWCEIPTFDKE